MLLLCFAFCLFWNGEFILVTFVLNSHFVPDHIWLVVRLSFCALVLKLDFHLWHSDLVKLCQWCRLLHKIISCFQDWAQGKNRQTKHCAMICISDIMVLSCVCVCRQGAPVLLFFIEQITQFEIHGLTVVVYVGGWAEITGICFVGCATASGSLLMFVALGFP
jgi:hypothetical protein